MRLDDLLDQALRRLPRAAPRPGFAARTLARLDEPAPSRSARRPLWAALAAAALILAAGAGYLGPWQRAQRAAERARLVAEHARLAQEIADLRSLLDAGRPSIAVPAPRGGALEVDVVALERYATELRSGATRGPEPILFPASF